MSRFEHKLLAPQSHRLRPSPAGQTEVVALDQPAARRRTLRSGRDDLEAALLQHPAGFGVVDRGAGEDLNRRGQAEASLDHRARRLGREALVPVFGSEGEPERQAVGAARFEADRTHDLAPALLGREHQRQVSPRSVGFPRRVDKSVGRPRRVRVGDARGETRDFPQAAEAMNRRVVGRTRPAQPKPRRLEAEHVISGKIAKHESSNRRPTWGLRQRRRRGGRFPFVSLAYRTDERASRLSLSSRSFTVKFRERPRGWSPKRGSRRLTPPYSAALDTRTLTYCRPSPLISKATSPAAVANSVWSVPMPTLRPAWNFVPRCRTRILPASTRSPPNFLTPRRRP